jgi:hypothetical protein
MKHVKNLKSDRTAINLMRDRTAINRLPVISSPAEVRPNLYGVD